MGVDDSRSPYHISHYLKDLTVFMGCALRNCGLQLLLDGVVSYLPSPIDVCNYAFDQTKNGEKVQLSGNLDGPLVALAFTMEHRRLSDRLTYLRIYQGVLRKGDFITNVNTGERIKVPRLFRRHKDAIKDVQMAHAGQIVAVFGADYAPGDTFTDGSVRYTMTPVKVPDDSVSEDYREQFQML